MLDKEGFDLWAGGYDAAVGLSDEEGSYPFAGYRDVLGMIYAEVMKNGPCRVLDIGFGTGVLTAKLYEAGCDIFGQDFSPGMIALAKEKMEDAVLICGDFTSGLADDLKKHRYDAIVATYSLHHLNDTAKVNFIKGLLPLLAEGGAIYIGDVAFSTRRELEACMEGAGEEWDDSEHYFVFEELLPLLPGLEFEKKSHCAGVFRLSRN